MLQSKYLRYLFGIYLALVLVGCGGTDVGDDMNLLDSNTDPNPIVEDTTPPVLSGSISAPSDSGMSQSSSGVWSAATDQAGIDFYEIAIAQDDGDSSCGASDFSGAKVLDWKKVPASADFSGAGFQIVDGNNDGDNNAMSLNLVGSQNYCTAVRATDNNGNQSSAIYSASVWNFLYRSCLEKKNNEPASVDGVFEIDPDGVGGDSSYNAFCDMTTQGGGWTLVIRYDSSEASAAAFSLPMNSGRTAINASDLGSLNATGNMAASADIRPFVDNGATHFMHVGKSDDAAVDSSTYNRYYFSDIYQSVIDDSDNLFNPSLDTNSGEGLSGAAIAGTSTVLKNRWYDSSFAALTLMDVDSDSSRNHRINGGEGDAMFTNGNREGAIYASGNSSSVTGHDSPKVQWGFRGKDNSQQSYGGTIHIGTYCRSNLSSCTPESQMNLMFVR